MKKLILAGFVIVMAVVGCYFAGLIALEKGKEQVDKYYAKVAQYFTRTEIVRVPVEVESKTLAQMIKDASQKHQVPKLIILAQIEQESGGKFRANRIRFEPGVYAQVKKNQFADEEVGRLWASSIGLMQIIPFFHLNGKSVDSCNLEYQELFDPEKNLDCGVGIMAACLKANVGINDKWERFRRCLKNYNGGEEYPQAVMSRLARLAIEGVL